MSTPRRHRHSTRGCHAAASSSCTSLTLASSSQTESRWKASLRTSRSSAPLSRPSASRLRDGQAPGC
eukprot:scaffold24997_cov90-Isochrysis_galbana.AAC.1